MIKFIEPTFNEFTLNFPPDPIIPAALASHLKIMDAAHEGVARDRAKEKAATRRAGRGLKRKMSTWIVYRPGFVEPSPNGRTNFEYAPSRQQRKAALRDANLLHAPVESALE